MRIEIHKLRQMFLFIPTIGMDAEYKCLFCVWLNRAIYLGKGKRINMELIDKADVVEKTDARITSLKRIGSENYLHDNYPVQYAMLETLKSLKFDINTLEVKEANDAYKQGYNDAIERTCKWLEFNFNMPDDFESHLKKAMEE